MAEAKTKTVEPAAVPADYPLTLDEFCARLSASDRRVELIGAFAQTERAAGRTRDNHDGYAKRYADFINLPA